MLTPMKAIRKKCLDCPNGHYSEVRKSTIVKCFL